MSQHQKILNLLENGDWVCTSLMYALFIADPRTRLVELKKLGYQLQPRWCENPAHRHEGKMKEWKLIGERIHPLEQGLYQTYKQAVSPPKTEAGRRFLEQWSKKPELIKQNSLF
jgi:Helix-turn-helix domain